MLAKNATLADRMKKLADAGVVFAACENSMRKKNVTKADLLPFVTTVDSGVAEVVRKQEAGWSYIKSGI
jgi:intracellular sulfur oxidation DsrE/DsrF family protein